MVRPLGFHLAPRNNEGGGRRSWRGSGRDRRVEGKDIVKHGGIGVERWKVVDTRCIKSNVLSAFCPVDVFAHSHLAVNMKTLWTTPAADELNDGVGAVGCV